MSTPPRILVTSAAGKTGLQVALQLCSKGAQVRAIVRREDARARQLRNAGADVVIADQYTVSDMRAAMHDVQRIYHCAPTAPNGLMFGSVFAAAALEAKPEHIVTLGQWLTQPEHPALFTREVWLNEQLLASLPGVTLTVVNPGWFADNYFMVLPMAAQLAILPMPLGDGAVKKNAPPSNEAIAAVAVAALMNPKQHAGKTYRPTGPDLLSPNEIAQAIGQALGHRVRYMAISEKMFTKALVAQPPSNFSYQALTQLALYAEEYRRGTFAVGGATDVVQRIGALAPESFAQTAARAVAMRPELRSSFSRRLGALAAFAKIAITPAPNLRNVMDQRDMAKIANPQFSMDNPDWVNTHTSTFETAV